MRLLIVNADDFGLNAACNAGILDAHLAGAVTSTTLMVNGDAVPAAAAMARQHPALAVGLHFNLTWGKPAAGAHAVPSLLGSDGRFLTRGRLARRLWLNQVPAAQIRCELQAQLARIADLGIVPSHIDSHQHVHGFAPVFDAMAEYCHGRGLPMRVPWVQDMPGAGLARRLRRGLLRRLLQPSLLKWHGRLRCNGGIGSIFDLPAMPPMLTDDHYRGLLLQARGNAFELMVHPVREAGAMQGYTRIGAAGHAEWLWLCQGRLPQLAQAAGFRMGSYRDL